MTPNPLEVIGCSQRAVLFQNFLAIPWKEQLRTISRVCCITAQSQQAYFCIHSQPNQLPRKP